MMAELVRRKQEQVIVTKPTGDERGNGDLTYFTKDLDAGVLTLEGKERHILEI